MLQNLARQGLSGMNSVTNQPTHAKLLDFPFFT